MISGPTVLRNICTHNNTAAPGAAHSVATLCCGASCRRLYSDASSALLRPSDTSASHLDVSSTHTPALGAIDSVDLHSCLRAAAQVPRHACPYELYLAFVRRQDHDAADAVRCVRGEQPVQLGQQEESFLCVAQGEARFSLLPACCDVEYCEGPTPHPLQHCTSWSGASKLLHPNRK